MPVGRVLRRGIVVGTYRIEDTLGSGGMGTVFAASDITTGRRVALKVPHPFRDERDAFRFARESAAVERLRSTHAPRVHDAGTFDIDGETRPYIAFELLDGLDVATWLAHRGPMPVAMACTVVVQACHAVEEAHAAGLVHRDIKPANLMIALGDVTTIKVLDFGLSRDAASVDERVTTDSTVLGTPAYMPPEQMRPSLTVDHRGDLWSLGVVLYELLTGALPFSSPSFPELCLQILMDEPRWSDSISPPLVDVLRRCLAKDPAARFSSAGALAHALRPYAASSLAITATDLELVALERGSLTKPVQRVEPVVPAVRSSRAKWPIVAAAMAAAVVAGFIIHRSPPVTAPALSITPVPTKVVEPTLSAAPSVVRVEPAPNAPVIARPTRSAHRSTTPRSDEHRPEAPTPPISPLDVAGTASTLAPAAPTTDPLASPF